MWKKSWRQRDEILQRVKYEKDVKKQNKTGCIDEDEEEAAQTKRQNCNMKTRLKTWKYFWMGLWLQIKLSDHIPQSCFVFIPLPAAWIEMDLMIVSTE